MFCSFFIFLIFFMISNCEAQVPRAGPCMEMERVANYDPSKILGRWYRYAAYPSCGPFGKCRQTVISDNNDGTTTIIEKQLSISSDETPLLEKMHIFQYSGYGGYHQKYPTDDPLFNQTLGFWDTDYTSYLIKGVCINRNEASVYYAWILTRNPNPSPTVIARINEAIKAEKLPPQFFRRDNHTDCLKEY